MRKIKKSDQADRFFSFKGKYTVSGKKWITPHLVRLVFSIAKKIGVNKAQKKKTVNVSIRAVLCDFKGKESGKTGKIKNN